jgi:hypothetical protein
LAQGLVFGEVAFGLLVGLIARKPLGLGERPFGGLNGTGIVNGEQCDEFGHEASDVLTEVYPPDGLWQKSNPREVGTIGEVLGQGEENRP